MLICIICVSVVINIVRFRRTQCLILCLKQIKSRRGLHFTQIVKASQVYFMWQSQSFNS